MKKEVLKQLITKPTRRMRMLIASGVLVIAVSSFAYYVGVVSPSLARAFSGTGYGTYDEPFQISTCDQLQEMKNNTTSYFVLMQDVDCSATATQNDGKGFEPIRYFTGEFDGRGFAIWDLYINRPNDLDVGLFAYVPGNAILRNVWFEKSPINANRVDITTRGNGGALAAIVDGGKISNVHSKLNINTKAKSEQGQGGNAMIGGVVGLLRGSIEHSSSSGNITIEANNLTGRYIAAGGLVGRIDDHEKNNSYVTIGDSFATGKVTIESETTPAGGQCGGLVGMMEAGRPGNQLITRASYSTGEVSCVSPTNSIAIGGFVGALSHGPNSDRTIELSSSFSVSKVVANVPQDAKGFFGSYSKDPSSEAAGDTDFSGDAFDATLSQTSSCGNANGNVSQCQIINLDNSQPDYFTNANTAGFFDTWEQENNWQVGSSYPTHKDWAVKTKSPTNLSVQRDNDNFNVSWTAPSGDGIRTKGIQDYQIMYQKQNGNYGSNGNDWGSVTLVDTEPDGTHTLTGLDSPAKYRFSIRARFVSGDNPNQYKYGLLSDPYIFSTGMPATAPLNIAVQPQPKFARVSWDALSGATIYNTEYRMAGEANWQQVPDQTLNTDENQTPPTQFDVGLRGLSPEVNYEVRVRAANAGGPGPWSDPVAFTTPAQQRYNISTCQQLQDIQNDLMGIYTLTKNIDCTDFDFQSIGILSQDQDAAPFMGELQGGGFTISNLTIIEELQTDGPTSDFRSVGLFSTTYRATIKNVTLANSAIVANYVLNEDVDSDQNGLPDAPEIAFEDIDLPNRVPRSIEGVSDQATDTFTSASEVLGDISPNFAIDTYGKMAKVAAGGVVGMSIGKGDYSNIRTVNTAVRGGLAGGVFGLVLPIDMQGASSLITGGTVDLETGMVLDSIHSDGLVVGHISGGLVGAAISPIGNAIGQPTALTMQNSSSSSETQGNIAGGLFGVTLDTSLANATLRVFSLGDNAPENEIAASITEGVRYSMNNQGIVINASQSTGLVSACESLSGIRIASLGGMIGISTGTLINNSTSSSPIRNCSSTPSNWGVYGGAMGGLGGIMISSRVINSSSSGTITAVENDTVGQSSVVNMYVGAVGGIAGAYIATDEDADGQYMINNSNSSGAISLDSKESFVGTTGGLLGIFIGSGTIQNSYSSSNITQHLTDRFIAGGSFAGGLVGTSLSVDASFAYNTAASWPATGQITHALVINDSHASGNIGVQKDAGGGHLAVGGGLMGLMIGQGSITNSYATGNVTGGLPDGLSLGGDITSPRSILTGNSTSSGATKYGAAISGGLVGATLGIDVPRILSRVLTGTTGTVLADISGGGITLNNTHASGSVKGNVAGGLVGSADLKTAINKSYAEGNVDGAIVGGVVGQAGFLQTFATAGGISAFTILVGGDVGPAASAELKEALYAYAGFTDIAVLAVGPVTISNTYATGNVTAIPGLADAVITSENQQVPIDSIRLPATAGGIAGLFMSPAGQITDSYAAGNLTVKADQQVVDRPATQSGQNVTFGKIPSMAGGIVGLNIALALPSTEKIMRDSLSTVPNTSPKVTDYLTDSNQVIKNVFSVSKMSLESETLSGGSIGVFLSPIHAVDAFVIGHQTTAAETSKIYDISNVYLDKSKISVANCNGPNKTVYDIAKPIVLGTSVKDGSGKELISGGKTEDNEVIPLRDILSSEETEQQLLDAPIVVHNDEGDVTFESTPRQVNEMVSNIINIPTACDYVNGNNDQQRYFVQNSINTPMNQWNFSSVWKVVKNDYPKFVAGIETDVPNDGGPSVPTTPTGTGTNTRNPVTPAPVTPETRQLIKNTGSRVAQKLGFNRNPEQVKGLKAILARVPVFLAKSIPYSLILILLIFASMYSYQALREYRQLSEYHKSILRITNTKESIDNYLAITTHYLNTPVAIMGGAVELLTSLKKISATKSASLQAKIKKFADASAGLLTANQVSNAQSANDEKLIKHEQPSPYKAKAVWVPAVIALGLIILANALFIYADVFNRSPYRIVVELTLYVLGVFLVGLAYRYRNFMTITKEVAKRQLAMESQLYKKREAFIPDAIKLVAEHFENIQIAGDSLKKVPEAKLFFNGLGMLEGIKDGLVGLKKFASFEGDPPLFDVTTYIQKAIHELNSSSADKKLSFDAKVSPGLLTRIQPEEIKQLVDSILGNAVKFSKEGGHIEVQAYRRFNQLVMSVSDDGVGISEQKLPSLLKPFSRATGAEEYNYEGLGLGLYTDKVIIERMGGTISIRSKLGEGTVVTVTIPMHREVEALAPVLITPQVSA